MSKMEKDISKMQIKIFRKYMCLNCGYLFMDSNDRIYSKCPECASGDLDSYSFKMKVDDDCLPLMDKQLMKEKDTKEKALWRKNQKRISQLYNEGKKMWSFAEIGTKKATNTQPFGFMTDASNREQHESHDL